MNNQQYRNGKILQATLRDMLTLDLPKSRLDSYLTWCGNYGCVAGETAKNLGMLEGVTRRPLKMKLIQKLHANFRYMFGFSEGFNRPNQLLKGDVFGASVSGSLYERLDYVDQHLIDYEIANNLETD